MASDDQQPFEEQQSDAQQANPTVNTPFPAPPPYWNYFTSENLAKFQTLEAKAAAGIIPIPHDIPPELQNLRPPTPPPNGQYRSFGEGRSVCLFSLLLAVFANTHSFKRH
jgi:hypothetical protein